MDLPLTKMKVNHKSENGTELTLKAFAHQKETLKERQGQPSEYKEIFEKEETHKEFTSKTNSSCGSISKIHTNQEKKSGPKIEMDTSPRKAYR